MKIKLILLFLAISVNLHAKKQSLEKYYMLICNAESAIIDSNYLKAEQLYDTAFSSFQRPFAIDIYNALYCSVKTNNDERIFNYSKKLILLGCDINFFKKPKYLSVFRKSYKWLALINQYPLLRQQYVKTNDWILRSKIEELKCKDQYLREQDPTREIFTDSINRVDNRIKYELLLMFKKKFPNEYDYGIFFENDTTIATLHPLHVILIHDYNSFDSSLNIDYTPYFVHAVKNGDMHPEDFGLLNDRAGKFKLGKGYGQDDILVRINNKFYYPIVMDNVKATIEKNRHEICLCELSNAREKLIYQAKNKNSLFFLRKSSANITIYNGMIMSDKQIKSAYFDTNQNL